MHSCSDITLEILADKTCTQREVFSADPYNKKKDKFHKKLRCDLKKPYSDHLHILQGIKELYECLKHH